MRNARMVPALRLSFHASQDPETLDYTGSTWGYFDGTGSHGRICYEQRHALKTKEGTLARQRRETKAYLEALRSQIDEVTPDEHEVVRIFSSAWIDPKGGSS